METFLLKINWLVGAGGQHLVCYWGIEGEYSESEGGGKLSTRTGKMLFKGILYGCCPCTYTQSGGCKETIEPTQEISRTN